MASAEEVGEIPSGAGDGVPGSDDEVSNTERTPTIENATVDDKNGSEYETESDEEETEEVMPDPEPDVESAHPGTPTDLRQWMVTSIEKRQGLTSCPAFTVDLHEKLYPFFSDTRVSALFMWLDHDGRLVFSDAVPTKPVGELSYFLKTNGGTILPADDFDAKAVHVTVRGAHLDSMVESLEQMYTPLLEDAQAWPKSIQHEFMASMNRFMGVVNDVKKKSLTELYIPRESKVLMQVPAGDNTDGASRNALDVVGVDVEFVQRMETVLIQWTRQIQEVLATLKGDATVFFPLDELEFWEDRRNNMSGIGRQLEDTRVQRIVEFLQYNGSPYVSTFESWCGKIQDGIARADSNVKFLSVLKEPCERFDGMQLDGLPTVFARVLNLIRLISVHSPFYNTHEQVNGLVQLFTNSVLRRLRQEITLDEIFNGDVNVARQQLLASIACCDQWSTAISVAETLHTEKVRTGETIDTTGPFAETNAFKQRCSDLLDVCNCCVDFARKVGKEQAVAPTVRGSASTEVRRQFDGIADQLTRALQHLESMGAEQILDTNSNLWYDRYNAFFKNQVRDLEVMVQNLLSTSIDRVAEVDAAVEILEIFEPLAYRDLIKRAYEKAVATLMAIFLQKLSSVKKEFSDRKNTPPVRDLSETWPERAGASLWSGTLREEIVRLVGHVRRATFIVLDERQELVVQEAEAFASSLRDYTQKMYNQWCAHAALCSDKLLSVPLMVRGKGSDRLKLVLNFSVPLLTLFQELTFFTKLGFAAPVRVNELYARQEELRHLREHVLLVVRDYNSIIGLLSEDERLLFLERIRFLDKKIQPGLGRLTWSSKGISEFYVADARTHAASLRATVRAYLEANTNVAALCHELSNETLVDIEQRKVYTLEEFEQKQRAHRERSVARMRRVHAKIVRTLQDTSAVFRNDGRNVDEHWGAYVKKTNQMLVASVKLCVKKSLQALSHVINGDGKSNVLSTLKASAVLSATGVELAADFDRHRMTLVALARDIAAVSDALPHLASVLSKNPKASTVAFASEVPSDAECNKHINAIEQGFWTLAPELNAYCRQWEEFNYLWGYNVDAFVKRYALDSPALTKFEADIKRYDEVANNVQKQETLTSVGFLLIDAAPLKQTLVDLCIVWRNKFTDLLLAMTQEDLQALTAYLEHTAQQLAEVPETLEQMIEKIKLIDHTERSFADTELRFGPITDRFAILEHFEIDIADDVTEEVNALSKKWDVFCDSMDAARDQLETSKTQFKTTLLHQSEVLTKKVSKFCEDFQSNGPFSADNTTSTAARASLANAREVIAEIRTTEASLRSSLQHFGVNQESYKEILDMEGDLGFLEQLWGVAHDFDTSFEGWSKGGFADIDTDDMEQQAAARLKKIVKLNREVKDKDWDMVQHYRKKITNFKATMPLIQDLKNPAMRARHWNQLMDDIGKKFDPESADFTLGTIVELGLEDFSEQVADISGAASKELQIETTLKGIVDLWAGTNLEIRPYPKDKSHFLITGTDEVYALLEDNQVTLSTMKASRFVKPFADQVEFWEKTLSTILEIIDMGLQVQRQWMYLENIFAGEDIRKQLPKETAMFDKINGQWKAIMTKFNADPNAQRACTADGLLATLAGMNDDLELIQKALDQYLEAKRQLFPRFYFVSNDDLLEILGQSRNPKAVQPHLLKCFDNVKSLELVQPTSSKKPMDAVGMFSADGEFVPFSRTVTLDGAVEFWLTKVEDEMRTSLRSQMNLTKEAYKKTKRDKWIKDWPGQLIIAISQLAWTADTTKAISGGKKKEKVAAKKGLKSMRRKQISFLKKLTEAIRVVKDKIQKKKIVALITIEVHARDVLEKLLKVQNITPDAFDWLMQLRYYWEKTVLCPDGDTVVRQTNTRFTYMYEYLGNSGRLVITPLTDRCYMTLTTALHLNNGGSPKGPAGTGKTETVKDLGKALGAYVIVVNCSEGLDYKSIGRMFSGLAQTGAWGCFDEFNRINIEVLSVVAQQVLCILTAIASVNPDNPETRVVFEGIDIRLRWSCGLFITMNPGYAGRTALPDNLKSMFRPISMMQPDSGMIAEIMLMGVGFGQAKTLAKKIYTCYALCEMQLSKQPHYDFKLRALVSIIRNAGGKRERNPERPEDEICVMACLDMNVAKMTADDLPLFLAIMGDLFPGIEAQETDYGRLKDEVIADLKAHGYQPTEYIVRKTLELYEIKSARHSVMIIGNSLGGKTTAYQTLQRAMTACQKKDVPGIQKVTCFPLNPKALTLDELYGSFNVMTNEWTDGVLSNIMRTICADEKPDQKWMVFDGPVQTDWIESMNSVMDDNKLLTLINGERISMPEQVSLLFEAQDVGVASPATVSRAGFVFFDVNDMGWEPYLQSWLDKREDATVVPVIRRCVDRFVTSTLDFVTSACTELVPGTHLNKVISLCNLLENLLTDDNGVVAKAETEERTKLIEKWFLFALVWSVGGGVDQAGRKLLDNFLRELEGQFPAKDTVYEYVVDVKTKAWVHWECRLKSSWSFPMDTPYYKVMVPTVDTLLYEFLLNTYLYGEKPVLCVGPVGTGKTQMLQSVLDKFDKEYYSVLNINMSSQTSSENVQEIIEAQVEKRTKGVFVPLGNKKMFTFIDDLNMPAKGEFGDQPPLELLRQWMQYGVWYDREKQVVKSIRNMFVCGAMGPPGGGRTEISMRLQSRFSLINMTFPSDASIFKIFGTIFGQRLQGFDEGVRPLCDKLNQATLQIYKNMFKTMLPTPSKIHYLFNLRDISKVFQGMFRANKDFHDTPESLQRLWVHEVSRVFGDRLVGSADVATFGKFVEEALSVHCDVNLTSICPEKEMPIFCDFLREGAAPVYEDVQDAQQLRNVLDEKLEDYNNTPGYVGMDLVLFKYCIEHVTRITRVIKLERGNMLLIGVGGSGRQSAARLAASILEYKIFQIEVTKTYRLNEFKEDLKVLYRQTGVDNKATMFLFNDTQIVEESMLELMNNILNSGQVANLFPAEELEEIYGDLTPLAKKNGIEQTPISLYRWFIERVRDNLHIVLCMSPVGEAFRNRMRMYPSLINCNTIDYFSPWPDNALLAVAEKFLDDVNFETPKSEAEQEAAGDRNVTEAMDAAADAAQSLEDLRVGVSKVFANIHQSVVRMSDRMQAEIRRTNFVTAMNYLELVKGYKKILSEKRTEIGDAADKLANGLEKIDDTKAKVEIMKEELKVTQVEVAAFQKECEEYLVVIVQQKREADEQQKAVTTTADKISIEAEACETMARSAQADLDEALPALEAAVEALNALNKGDITEIKSYSKPPSLVEMVMEAVMILRKNKPDWTTAKKDLAAPNFIQQLIDFDKENISEATRKKITKYTNDPLFEPDVVGKQSAAAKSLCMWVRAMEVYSRIFKVVEPKRLALQESKDLLAKKQKALAKAQANLAEVVAKVAKLQADYEAKLKVKDDLAAKAAATELKLQRAEQLVDGLAGERVRWSETVKTLRGSIPLLIGDCLMASGFLSYLGPFISEYRKKLVSTVWIPQMQASHIPHSPGFNMADFLAKPVDVRFWNIQGLPADQFSTENGVIVTRGERWPLMIDPQGQAIKWVKNMEGKRGLKIIDLQMKDFLRTLENSIQFGNPVLLQNVGEELDPSLEPVLNKSFIKVGGRLMIRLGDKEVDFNPDFKFYITTKMGNPVYGPDISTKVTLVNFAVVLTGLEEQMLGVVVKRERPDLEQQKGELVVNIAGGKKKLADLEDKILYLLANAKGSLLDDVTLLDTLTSSKDTSVAVNEQLEVAETTEKEIDVAREGYRLCANRAAVLFFVLNDIEAIDPMYQFALDAYIKLFNISIGKAKKSNQVPTRIDNINEYHTYAVYRSTCIGLFEKDKLLFAMHLNAKVLEASKKINMVEYNFFLRGGQVLDRSVQIPNPAPTWITEPSWDNITELDKHVPKFSGLVNSFLEADLLEWKGWYQSERPESTPMPGEWEAGCNELQKMVLVRALRPDRVTFVATSFIVNTLGQRFVEPPPLDMNAVLGDSTPAMPLIFVLSAGVDPTRSLIEFAAKKGMGDRLKNLSLGQGQAPIAEAMIATARTEGHWVFLANCHLSLSWMPKLAKIVETMEEDPPHEDFMLWLSSSPTPQFPISILQAGIKMTTEPPQGLKANMKRLYASLTEDQFEQCQQAEKYKKLLLSLAFFHSVLIVRRKFQMLGWNVVYPFNDSDFIVSESILSLYLDEYEETPWEAMRYLISGVMYGGHVTDDRDRLLLMTYINDVFRDEALETGFELSYSDKYTIQPAGPLQDFADYVAQLPNMDPPEAFGQHPNADISSMIREATGMLGTLVSLQPIVASGGGQSNEDIVYDMAGDMAAKVPQRIDLVACQKLLKGDNNPLNVVLFQEIERYNVLLGMIKAALVNVQKGVKGLVVMSSDLEDLFTAMLGGIVPELWKKTYPSQKPLAAWFRDLIERIAMFSEWAIKGRAPTIFWLSAFSFPTGFLTAVLQNAARNNNVAIDMLTWDFTVMHLDEANIKDVPVDGAYIRGLYLEGAGWDRTNGHLVEANPMELVQEMPVILFKPIENAKGRVKKGCYACPLYYYPNRAGEGGAKAWSYVISVDLKSGASSSEHWIKRGVALLMSLET